MKAKKFSSAERARHQNNSHIAFANGMPLGHRANRAKLDKVFFIFYDVLDRLDRDEESFVNDQSEPVSIASDGTWFKIRPNFTRMCDAFQNVSKDLAVESNFAAIRDFVLILGTDTVLLQSQLNAVREEIAFMRQLASQLTPNQLACYIDAIRTRIEFERLGIVATAM